MLRNSPQQSSLMDLRKSFDSGYLSTKFIVHTHHLQEYLINVNKVSGVIAAFYAVMMMRVSLSYD